MKSMFTLTLVMCGLWTVLISSPAAAQPGSGPHEYITYPGTVTILRVEKLAAADDNENTRGKAREGYAVWFSFEPKEPVKQELGREYLKNHKEHQFTLMNGWLPGPKYIEKYGLKKGAELPGTMSVIVRGTTTPVILEIDGVDRADYFEAAPQAK